MALFWLAYLTVQILLGLAVLVALLHSAVGDDS